MINQQPVQPALHCCDIEVNLLREEAYVFFQACHLDTTGAPGQWLLLNFRAAEGQ